jgi:hypothetical protein
LWAPVPIEGEDNRLPAFVLLRSPLSGAQGGTLMGSIVGSAWAIVVPGSLSWVPLIFARPSRRRLRQGLEPYISRRPSRPRSLLFSPRHCEYRHLRPACALRGARAYEDIADLCVDQIDFPSPVSSPLSPAARPPGARSVDAADSRLQQINLIVSDLRWRVRFV